MLFKRAVHFIMYTIDSGTFYFLEKKFQKGENVLKLLNHVFVFFLKEDEKMPRQAPIEGGA